MSIAASFGSSVGSIAGKAGAYAKHAALSSVAHAGVFGATVADAARTSYALKDQQLARRRAELDAIRNARGPVAMPARKSQRKLAA